ncbi:MAG: hypothetical protein NTV48_03320 [Candidatus Vogelbacteria bacterium]|nr:hypothetical protein [Candidatus Vogelbacteria bacterium]
MPKKHPKTEALTSVIRVNPKGFGFIEPALGETLFVPPGQLGTALDNDIVAYRPIQNFILSSIQLIRPRLTPN